MVSLLTAVPDDETFLRAWRDSRDQRAFRALVEKYSGLVYGTAFRRSGRSDWAEDVVQEVFILFVRRAAQLKGTGGLAGWLHRAALNKVRHRMRAEARREAIMQKLADDNSRAEAPSCPPEAGAALLPLLDEAIGSLAKQDRQLIFARYFQQLSFAEAGAGMGLTEEAARKRSQRVLAKLNGKLRRKTSMPVAAAVAGLLTGAAGQAVPPGLPAKAAAAALVLPAAGAGAPGFSLLSLLSMKASTVSVMVLAIAIAGGLSWQQYQKRRDVPQEEGVVAAAPAGRTERKRAVVKTIPEKARRTYLPAMKRPSRAATAGTGPPDADLTEAFQNHPRTKAAEKRINALKQGLKTLLSRRLSSPDLIDRHNEAYARMRNQSLSREERAAAAAETARLRGIIDEAGAQPGIKEFREEWEQWMHADVLEVRASILDEIKRGRDQTPAARDQGGVPPSGPEVPGSLAPDGAWNRMLQAMLAGDATAAESACGEMMSDTASAASFALAAAAIAQGTWEEAQIWVDQAWEHGTPQENAAFSESLAGLGWMEPGSNRLIPPREDEQKR